LIAPFTEICIGGRWGFATHGGSRHVVLLVNDRYRVPEEASIDYHPSIDAGVVAWAEEPPTKRLDFGGETWFAKDSNTHPTGPDGNVFSEDNAGVDGDGNLQLALVERGGRFTAAEAHRGGRNGFGVYTARIVGRLDDTNDREVRAVFLYAAPTAKMPWEEIDLECSRALTGCAGCCQFVVQPFDRAGNREIFPMSATATATVRFEWRPDQVAFTIWEGFDPYPPPPEKVIHAWTYSGPDVPQSARPLAHANLWLAGGIAPADRLGAGLVLAELSYRPLPDR
jgi:hypothetical protein